MSNSPERPLTYLQYAGGNSISHEPQDKSDGWGKFFEAQSLVQKMQTKDYLAVVMKTSEISPTGVMVVHASTEGELPIRNIGDLDLEKAKSHLDLVASVMFSLETMLPDDQLKLWQINNTAHPPYGAPSDLGNPLQDVPMYTSQTIATLHSHCDSISERSLIPIRSLTELKQQHAIHLGKSLDDKTVKAFLHEKRRNIKPRVFHRIARAIWETELSPILLKKYPNVFEKTLAMPLLSLQLKGDWETLRSSEFAEALLLTHQAVSSKWREVVGLIKNPKLINEKDKILRRLSKVIQQDRVEVPDRRNWLHADFNYTVGIVKWKGTNPIFFIDPTVDVGSGIQAINVHSIRESRELTKEEVREREKFRARITQELLSNEPSLQIGKEGKYLLQNLEK